MLAIAILGFLALAAVTVVVTAQRRDTRAATGVLDRTTRREDRGRLAWLHGQAPVSGQEVERSAKLARGGTALEAVHREPVPYVPLDNEALGVTRRQFLNRSMTTMLGLGLAGFGAATLAFLWPGKASGFGAKFALPAGLGQILSTIDQNKEPYYYAPGRLYVERYPRNALSKARKAYSGAVLAGMESGIVVLYQKCVHLGCRVPFCKTSQWFECPCHGSQYSRVGEKKGGPAPRGLDRFSVDVTGDRVTVDTGIIVQGPPIGTNTTGQEAEGPHCVGGAKE